MQSEAFAPTPQFMQVSRIEDNEELRNRRSSITSGGNGHQTYGHGDDGSEGPKRGSDGPSGSHSGVPMKRQVAQFTEVGALADNPEMRRRREAYLHDRIMDHSKV
jgi:hypothetical protein